jgi:hypothetical protein
MEFSKRHYLIVVGITLLAKIYFFIAFSMNYTDGDQTILWQVTKDYAEGIFYGPCFYGQAYNPNLEPLVALPFYLLGTPLNIALPLATTLLSTIPFFIFSLVFKRKWGYWEASIPLLILLFLSTDYDIMTSIPRGFVTGIFFGSIAYALWMHKQSALYAMASGALFGLGLYFNLNTILIAPLFIIDFPKKIKTTITWASLFLFGSSIGIVLILWSSHFYKTHPEWVIHQSPSLKFGFTYFLESVKKFYCYFDQVVPLTWRGWGILVLPVLVCFALYFRKKYLSLSLAIFGILTGIILTFFMEKTADCGYSPFFSGGRFFLAIPFVLMVILAHLSQTISKNTLYKIQQWIFVPIVVITTFKIAFLSSSVAFASDEMQSPCVVNTEISSLKSKCENMKAFSENAELYISLTGDTPEHTVTYGCECLIPDFGKTLNCEYERRRWRSSMNSQVFRRILIHGDDVRKLNKLDFHYLQIIKVNIQKGWLLVETEDDLKTFMEKSHLNASSHQ